MVAPSMYRVSQNTEPSVNDQIRRQTEMNICYFESHPEEIEQRLQELDEEWDIERALETGSSALTLTGLTLGLLGSKKWLLLSLAVQGFFMQHALQGWCPPLPVLRRMGFRTVSEIEMERRALEEMLDQPRQVPGGGGAQEPMGQANNTQAAHAE